MARLAGEHMGTSNLGRYGYLDEPGDASRRAIGLRRSWMGRRRPLFRVTVLILLLVLFGLYYTSFSRPSIRVDSVHSAADDKTLVTVLNPLEKSIPIGDETRPPFQPPHEDAITPSLDQPAKDPPLAHSLPTSQSSPTTPDVTPDKKSPLDVPSSRQYKDCAAVSPETLSALQSATSPTIRVLSKGQVVSEDSPIQAPAPVCILVAIPQTRLPEQDYTDAPVPNKGPDSIHLYLNATDVIVTFPPLDPLPGQPEASTLHTTDSNSIVYYADTILYTAGVYNIVAENEFAHWFWAQEWQVIFHNVHPVTNLPNSTILTTTGNPPGALYETHEFRPRSLPRASITVSGSRALPSRPPCSDTVNAGVGRWYKQSSFSDVLSKAMTDEWGYTWQGDFCHLSHFTPAETVQCFENKNIQFFGDSMTRRMLKAIVSGGEWCRDLNDDCQDADDGADGMIDTLDMDTATGELVQHSMPRGSHFQTWDRSAIKFGSNSSAYFSFLTQLGHWPGDWMDRIYDAEDLVVLKEINGPENNETTNRAIKPGALSHARPVPESGAVDLVVIGFGAWDQAFTDRFDTYENQLAQFRDAMITAYSPPGHDTPMIMRMSNSWCCRGTENSFRRYTGSRICEFDARTKKIFNYTASGNAVNGRIMVVDPINMNGRADVLSDYPPSAANHPRASHVRLEMQMLMNSVCVRDKVSGKVKLRGSV